MSANLVGYKVLRGAIWSNLDVDCGLMGCKKASTHVGAF